MPDQPKRDETQLEGDSFKVVTPGITGMNLLSGQILGKMVAERSAGGLGRVRSITFYAPDGTDPGISSNSGTIYVGPNKSAAFPIGPGAYLTLEWVDPANVGVDDKGTAGTLFVTYGGSGPG